MFQFEGIQYKYACLPNSLSTAPRIFTKLMKPVLSSLRKKGHQDMNYFDDFFLVGDTYEECKDAIIDTCDLLIKLGFSIHPDKSQFISVQKIEHIGFSMWKNNNNSRLIQVFIKIFFDDAFQACLCLLSSHSFLQFHNDI